MNRTTATIATATILPALLFLAGCGSDPSTKPLDLGGEDANAIGALIDDINDAKGNSKRLAAIFAADVKPDVKKLDAYDYSLGGKPRVSGETATCLVRIDDPKTGTNTQKEWSFIREGGTWKVKAAPLP